MKRISAPYVVSGLLAAAALAFSGVLIADSGPFAPGAALLIAVGAWTYVVVAIAGMLLVRAPWARWLGLGTAIGMLAITAIIGFDTVWTILAIGTALVAIGGLAGPWLTVWLRQRPGTGPEAKAVALPLVAIGAPLVAGLASWPGPTVGAIITAVVGPLAAWGYGRSFAWGLWTLRIAYPVVALGAATQLDPAGAALILAHGVAVTLLAWSRAASRAQRPVGGPLPAPRYRKRTP